eukprot:GDKI01017991.1.p1 GENE.GDKI01017991.1~~GDKI01017991.1.p1  ORF type:complete len:269 (-),score=72.02 GDKI01017991.1:24-728(-)
MESESEGELLPLGIAPKDMQRKEQKASKGSSAAAASSSGSGRKITLENVQVKEGQMAIQCEDGVRIVNKSLFTTEPFANTPLANHVLGTEGGLRGTPILPCTCAILDAINHYSYYKSLPKLQEKPHVEENKTGKEKSKPPTAESSKEKEKEKEDVYILEEQLLVFADYFLLPFIIEEVERKERQRSMGGEQKEMLRQRRELEKERLTKRHEANVSRYLKDEKFIELGRLRGVVL